MLLARGRVGRAALAAAALFALGAPAHAANFYVEYVVLVDLAHGFCRGYLSSDGAVAQAILDRNTALGVKFMGQAAFDAELAEVRTARVSDAKHMDTKAWCEKTRREIIAHGDAAMFPANPPPKS